MSERDVTPIRERTYVKCQVCQRMLRPLKSGLHRSHKPHRYGEPYSRCQGSGYRAERWPVGQKLWHHSGDLWEIVEDRGGRWGDYYLRCLRGREKGREMVGHGEYMHRHGWEAADDHA
jgi:hypothetical protein